MSFASRGWRCWHWCPSGCTAVGRGYHSKALSQYACYAFYPVHMLLLVLVLNFVNR